MLSDSQLRLIAETVSNVGVVFFGSMVVPLLAGSEVTIGLSLVGFCMAIVSWTMSVIILKKVKV